MYFGDEDPALLADAGKPLTSNFSSAPENPPPSEPHPLTPPPDDNQLDMVLMWNEESGLFEYSCGGADMSMSFREDNGEGNGEGIEEGTDNLGVNHSTPSSKNTSKKPG